LDYSGLSEILGLSVGEILRLADGLVDGLTDGNSVGEILGISDGLLVGSSLGASLLVGL